MQSRSARPSRILLTADTVGGVWTYSLELARSLAREGIQIALATMGRSASEQQRTEAAMIPGLQLFESTYRLPWMDEPWSDIQSAGDWLLDLASRTDPDIIHLNEPVFGALEWAAPTVAVAHSCVLSWWEAVCGTSAPPRWARYREEMGRGLRGADRVVAPSRWMLEEVRRLYRVSGGQVIPNGRHAGELYPEEKEPVIFAAGRLWDQAKNLLLLEQVAGQVPWPIHLAGESGPPEGSRQVNVERVKLLGQLPPRSVAAQLRRAAIYAFPARYEPFGLSVLEAALAGCALVLGDVPTLRELWEGAAVFVSPDSPDDLRLALNGLIEEPLLRQALAMRARRRALQFTPDRMARSYLDLYASLLSDSRSQETVCVS